MAKVFLVDDHPDVRSVYEELLKMHSHAVESYSSAVDILQRVKSQRPDVLILDQNLPKLSGLQLLEVVRADRGLDSVYVVMYSGSATVKDIALAAGAQQFWVKGSDGIFDRIEHLEVDVSTRLAALKA